MLDERRALLAGACLMAAGLAVAAGGLARFVSSEAALGAFMRMLDPLAPWLLGLGAVFSLVVCVLGVWRWGAILLIVIVGFSAEMWLSHRALSLPLAPGAEPQLRVLFFNAWAENVAAADRIVDATLAAAPDIAVFAEAAAVRPALDRLRAEYTFVSPCSAAACEILVASRYAPERFWTLSLNPIWDDRYAVIEIRTETGAPLFLAANHLTKPWFSGVAESEAESLSAQYNWFVGPVVAVGDFNMPPWSRPMRRLLAKTEMRTLRRPLATWPAGAGRFGLPIDQILMRGGPRVVSIVPFGAGLGSNHRGFVADIKTMEPPSED